MPRKRAGRLPSALIKAFLPAQTKRKQARRKRAPSNALPTTIIGPKVVRAAVRAVPEFSPPTLTSGNPATRRPATRKPAARKPAARKPAARKPATRKPATGRAAARSTSARTRKPPTPNPSATGRGTWRQARYTGIAGTRSYRVYVPHGLRRTTKAPLVLALHGCGQSALDFAAGTRFNQLADKRGFVVVYPEQPVAHNGQRCWNWFRPAHQFRSQGEPAILAGIVRRVIQDTGLCRIDPERIYVAGLSAGGAMAVVLAATYPDLFAAVGVHSAPPYRSASDPANAVAAMQGRAMQPPLEATATRAMPPMIVFQGTLDGTVRPVNARRVADQWLAYQAHDARRGPARHLGSAGPVGGPRVSVTSPARPSSARSRRGFTVSRWYSGGLKVLEVWVVDGLGHAWSGGSVKGSYADARGPRATTEMWKFFGAHRLSATALAVRAG